MDAILEQRWQSTLPPFDGYTLVLDESLHKIVGTAIVRFLFHQLDLQFGLEDELLVNEDWHVHDGFVNESQSVAKADLFSQLENDPTKWIRVLDYQVYWGVYDSSFRFYLRFGLEEDMADVLSIDLTTDEKTLRALEPTIRTVFKTNAEIVAAKEYFDRTYGG